MTTTENHAGHVPCWHERSTTRNEVNFIRQMVCCHCGRVELWRYRREPDPQHGPCYPVFNLVRESEEQAL